MIFSVLSFVFTALILWLSYFFNTPYITIALLLNPVLASLKNDSVLKYSSLTSIELASFNVYYYYMAFENDDKYSFFTIFSLLIAINLVYISIQLFFLKKVKELEDKPTEEAIAKLDKEREEFIKAKAEINHKLKDFKLEMSQKLTIIRKLIENLKDSKDVNENRKLFITALKNTLKPKSFIIFFYDKESNSFKKLYDESVEMSEIKSSTLLKWTIERAFNFPANINILDKHTIDKNPEFSKIKDDNLPEIFIPIKDKNILLGFIIIYKTEESLTNSENKTIAHLLSEIASFLRKFELI